MIKTLMITLLTFQNPHSVFLFYIELFCNVLSWYNLCAIKLNLYCILTSAQIPQLRFRFRFRKDPYYSQDSPSPF